MNGRSPRYTRTAGTSGAGSASSKAKLWWYRKADHWTAIVIDPPSFSIWRNDMLEIYTREFQSSTRVLCSTDCSLLRSSLSCFNTTGNKNIKVDLLEWVILRTTLKRLTIILSSLPAFSKITEIKLGIFPFFVYILSQNLNSSTWY